MSTHIWLQIHRGDLFFLSELRPRQVSLLPFLAGQQVFLTYPVTEIIALRGLCCHFAKWLSLTSVGGLAYWACSGFYFPVGFKSLVYSGYWNPNYQEALHFFFYRFTTIPTVLQAHLPVPFYFPYCCLSVKVTHNLIVIHNLINLFLC